MKTKLALLSAALMMSLAPTASAQGVEVDQEAPEITVASWMNGEALTLKGLREQGRVVLLEFWATWCPPCRKSIPHLKELWGRYQSRGVTIISVTNEARSAKIEDFVNKEFEMTWPIAYDDKNKTSERYGITGIPHAAVIDAKGIIRWLDNPLNSDPMEEMLDRCVAQAAFVGIKAEGVLKSAIELSDFPALIKAAADAGEAGKQALAACEKLAGYKLADVEDLCKLDDFQGALELAEETAKTWAGIEAAKNAAAKAEEIRKAHSQDIEAQKAFQEQLVPLLKQRKLTDAKTVASDLAKKYEGTRAAKEAADVAFQIGVQEYVDKFKVNEFFAHGKVDEGVSALQDAIDECKDEAIRKELKSQRNDLLKRLGRDIPDDE